MRREIAGALQAIDAIADGGSFVFQDDFGTSYIDPSAFADGTHSPAALGVLTAAEGLTLAFSDEEATSFEIGDLAWAAASLRAIDSELVAVGEDRLQLPFEARAEHIRMAVLREISRRTEVDIVPADERVPVRLRGSDLLDPQQQAAVEAPPEVDLLVNAGAGSGKTHMLSMRIARLVAERDVEADRCIVLTFSRAAREQIQSRLSAFAMAEYPALTRVDVRTIHSLGRRILHTAASAGKTRVRPGFQVITDGRRRLGDGKPVNAPLPFLEEYDRLFYGVDDGRSERARLALYPNAINALRMGHPRLGVVSGADELPDETDVTILDPRTGELTDLKANALRTVWRRYEELLSAHNAIDFAGLITEAMSALQAHPALARVAAAPYLHVFVDEFQDTSLAQNELLFELARQGAVLSCVGDGDQTIFSFAGADPRSLTDFADRLRERTGREATVMPLEQNYRSVPQIVDAAESVIAHNASRLSKRMVAVRDQTAVEPAITVVRAPLRYAAPWLALQVRRLIDGGVEPADIAVLFRKEGVRSKQESAVLQHLEKLAIPVATEAQDADGVRLVSIHQAKGSEFRHVLCLYLGPGHFPDDRGDSEEERRLLYVAITRAMDSLIIAGEPGAEPDLFSEALDSHPDMNSTTINSLTEVLAVDAIDESILELTDMENLDPSILDWDEPESAT
ncbi:MAG TPA: ATP-dependent helicase [Candidatus Limnocylindria bacterium]|nr:ATP-dependent helicase [Candidatus Limnocylindria bacterium]